MIWAELIVTRVVTFAEHMVDTGRDVDDVLAEHDTVRVHVAELISRAGAAHGLGLPMEDDRLLAVLRQRGKPHALNLGVSGLVLGLPGDRVAFTVGGGRVVESIGDTVAVVNYPDLGRYTDAFVLPNVQLWEYAA